MHILGYNTTDVATFHFRRKVLTVVKSTAWLLYPADISVFSTWVRTCEASLFFQNPATHRQCRRKLLLHNQTPFIPRRNLVDLPVCDATPCLRARPQR